MTPSPQSLIAELIEWFETWPLDAGASSAWRMTGARYPFRNLFSPIMVNALELENRIVMGPMGNLGMVDGHGRPSDKMIAYFTARARGGTGLLISGMVPVSPRTDPSVLETGNVAWFPRIDGSRSVLSGWRDLATSVQAQGARFFIQLSAGLGRVGSPECLSTKWRPPVSASWNPNFYVPQVPSRPLLAFEIRRLVQDMGQAAINAQESGIDGIQLHGHEGYLLEQFANPAFNRRSLGRYADWKALGIDLVREIRDRCGPNFPIMYRIDLSLALSETYGTALMAGDPVLKRFRGERSVEMSLAYMRALVDAGVDMFDVDLGCYENWWLPHPPGPMPAGAYLRVARLVKRYFEIEGIKSNAGQDVPVVAVGKLGLPDLAEQALEEGACDMIMLARPLLADPDWPRKTRSGKLSAITPCIGDHQACLHEILHGGHIQCAVNPRTGFEESYPEVPAKAEQRKRIAVVGAGPAGVTLASVAARRGHDVVLFEKADRVGGWLVAGSAPAIKFDVANYLVHLEERLSDAVRDAGLDLRLSTSADLDVLRRGHFDIVVCCTGSEPIRPSFEQEADVPVDLATNVLLNPLSLTDFERIAIVGGGDVGCETAHMLSYEHGKQVTVIEVSSRLMAGACTANRGYLIRSLIAQGVTLKVASRVERICVGKVEVVRNVSPTVPAPEEVWHPVLPRNILNPFASREHYQAKKEEVPAEIVLFATGLRSNSALYHQCIDARVAPEILRAGDSARVGRVFDATRTAYALAVGL